jgi:hypothetical protein
MRFALTYRGRTLKIEIGVDATRRGMREVKHIAFRHKVGVIELTPDNPIAERPKVT